MPNVRNVDRSAGHAVEVRWIAPPSLPVCESAQVLDRRAGSGWPFLYSYTSSRCVINTAPRKSEYAQAEEIGDALL